VRRLVSFAILLAVSAMAQDFPDWRTQETRNAIVWREPFRDTLEGSVSQDSSGNPWRSARLDSLIWLNVNLHSFLSAAMWPVEKVVTPVGRYMLVPLREPALYAEREDVTDRGVRLVQIGSDGKAMAYPTMVMDGGTGSRLGATLLTTDLFGSGWYARVAGSAMVNLDWYGAVNALSPAFLYGERFRMRIAASKSDGAAVWVPSLYPLGGANTPISVLQTRQLVSTGLSIPLGKMGGIEPSWSAVSRSSAAPSRRNGLTDDISGIGWFDHGDRGLRGDELTQAFGLVWNKSSRDFDGIPSSGGHQSVAIERTSCIGGGDAYTLSLEGTRFILIGDEKYAYRKGDIEPYLHFSPNTIIDLLDPRTLRQRLTQRRILALKMRAVRMWEVDEARDPVSFFNFPSMGGDAPARAYGGGRLMDRSVIGGSAEYRWPIWRYIDGVFFTELAWAAPEWWQLDADNAAPGVGTGIRVRTRDMFLFRGHVAYGREGSSFLVTVSQEF